MTRFSALVLLLAVVLPRVAGAAITISSSNATNSRVTSSRPTFSWPITTASAFNLNYCANSRPYGVTKFSPTTGLISFTVSSDVITTSTNTYVHAEITSGTASLNIFQNASDTTGWSAYGGGDTTITLYLGDLCTVAKAGTLACDFANLADNQPEPQAPLTLRIGITTGQIPFCTNSTTCGTNGTATTDWQEVLVEFVRCASLDASSSTSFNDAVSPAERYSYGLTASPGDGRAKINLTSFPAVPATAYPYKSVIYLLEESTTLKTDPMSPGSVMVREISGGPGIGSTTIDGLTNDKTYNVQVAFVNVGNLITPPGPPLGINGDTSAAAPQVTPSSIGGLLSEDACFIASATAGHGSTIVNVLRSFRDQVLTRSAFGVKFVQWYYGWSPLRAQWLEEHPAWKPVIRVLLWPITVIAAIAVWMKSGPAGTILFFTVGTPILLALVAYAMQRSHGGRRRRSKKKGKA